jgi:hypothetical protein
MTNPGALEHALRIAARLPAFAGTTIRLSVRRFRWAQR